MFRYMIKMECYVYVTALNQSERTRPVGIRAGRCSKIVGVGVYNA
ncbi:MAG: hypothetical protein RLZZ226_1780, partial [Pseudomonadota bacterium]